MSKMSKKQKEKREKIVKSMKRGDGKEFEKRYPGRGKEVMYATATKSAMKEHYKNELLSILEYKGGDRFAKIPQKLDQPLVKTIDKQKNILGEPEKVIIPKKEITPRERNLIPTEPPKAKIVPIPTEPPKTKIVPIGTVQYPNNPPPKKESMRSMIEKIKQKQNPSIIKPEIKKFN